MTAQCAEKVSETFDLSCLLHQFTIYLKYLKSLFLLSSFVHLCSIRFLFIKMNSLECGLCGLYLSSVSNKNRHEKEQHSNKPKLECEICDMTFLNKSNLTIHFTRATHKSAGNGHSKSSTFHFTFIQRVLFLIQLLFGIEHKWPPKWKLQTSRTLSRIKSKYRHAEKAEHICLRRQKM